MGKPVDAVLGLLGDLVTFLLDLVPDVSPPAWLVTGAGQIAGVFENLGKLSHWFPVGMFGPAVVIICTAMAAGFGIKVGRSVLSTFTGGGGSSG